MTEIANPLMVRRSVSFGEAVYATQIEVEGILARLASDMSEVHLSLSLGIIPVLVDPQADCRAELLPIAVVDAIMAKSNLNTRITDAPCVVALGPGFTAGVDCHVVIETNRGHNLGQGNLCWKCRAGHWSTRQYRWEDRGADSPLSSSRAWSKVRQPSAIRLTEGQTVALGEWTAGQHPNRRDTARVDSQRYLCSSRDKDRRRGSAS